jgi:DNA helicase-2/ATP-dependent DNA helicase PcrA
VLSWANSSGLSIWDAASTPEDVPGLGSAAVKALGSFMGMMAELRDQLRGGSGVGDLIESTISRSGYLEFLEAERTIEAEGRTENLREFVEVGRQHDSDTDEPGLASFLSQVSLVADSDERDLEGGQVTLMTLHNAKGLEYPVVFVIACEEGLFPHQRSIEEGGIEEERRLAYVAITRAERELALTWARRRNVFGVPAGGIPSRFLSEIPYELVEGRDGVPVTASPSGWGGLATLEDESGQFRLGADVVHEQFGAGVVTALEPGGVVAVRFQTDGAERRLVAALAPLALA